MPEDLKNTTWYKEGHGNISEFFFTNDRLKVGTSSVHTTHVVKVTGKKLNLQQKHYIT